MQKPDKISVQIICGADGQVIRLGTDTEMIFDNEDDEMFHCFLAKDVAAAAVNFNKLLMEYDSYGFFIN